MTPDRSLGHRAPLLWLALPFLAGLAASRTGPGHPSAWPLTLALAAAITALLARERPALWAAAMATSLFCAGFDTETRDRARLHAWESLPPREAHLTLRLDRVFPGADPARVGGLGTVLAAADHLRDLPGQRIHFALALRRGEKPPVRSSELAVVGVLATLPAHPAPDSFDGFLAAAGVNFRLTRGRVLAVTRPPDAYHRWCADQAERWREILGWGIAAKRPTLAGLLRAMMLGDTHELTGPQHALFLQSGTMHLFAISGLNIAVIATVIHAALLLLRLPAVVRLLVGTALLWLFVDITGASPSAIRAFAMAAFVQVAWVLRQPANLVAALTASMVAVLAFAPRQAFSASFLMSYAIVAALLLLGAPLAAAWQARLAPWRDLPREGWTRGQRLAAAAVHHGAGALAVGVATSLVGIVTGVQFFHLLTPGSLLTNLVLIPAAMAATLGGFAAISAGLAGLVPAAVLANHAAAVVLAVIEEGVRWSVRLPGAFLPAQFRAAWLGPVGLAVLLASFLWGYAHGWRRERGGWWPPFVVTAVLVGAGMRLGG